MTEKFTSDEGTGVSDQPRNDTLRPRFTQQLRDAIDRRDADYPKPDAQTVIRTQPRQVRDVGLRCLPGEMTEDGFVFNIFDLINILNSTPVKH